MVQLREVNIHSEYTCKCTHSCIHTINTCLQHTHSNTMTDTTLYLQCSLMKQRTSSCHKLYNYPKYNAQLTNVQYSWSQKFINIPERSRRENKINITNAEQTLITIWRFLPKHSCLRFFIQTLSINIWILSSVIFDVATYTFKKLIMDTSVTFVMLTYDTTNITFEMRIDFWDTVK